MFTHNSPGNTAPVASAANRNIDLNQWRLITELVGVTDAEGNPINQYQVRDTTNTASSGYLWADGVAYGQGATVTVSNLANTWVRGGANAGADTYEVRAFDGITWGAWAPFTLTTRTIANRAPVVAPTAPTQAVGINTPVAASMLFGVTDADGDAPFAFELWDGGAGGGLFKVNGVSQPANQAIALTPGQLAITTYVGGASTGSETLWARTNDGQAWSGWVAWSMNTA
jgi:serralysin